MKAQVWRIKRTRGEFVFDSINYVFMFLLMLVTIYPFLHLLMLSFSDAQVLKETGSSFMLWPKGFSLSAYKRSLTNPRITRALLMSVFYVVAGTAYNLVMVVMAGYFYSRKNLLLKKFIMPFLVIPMFFSGGLIPSYLVNTKILGLRDSIWIMILPGAAISLYSMAMVRANIVQIPVEMEESAFIDGANHIIVLFRIIVPMITPIIAVMALWGAVGIWNEWFTPLIYITDQSKWPLQVILREIMVSANEQAMNMSGIAGPSRMQYAETIKGAVAMIATIPVLCIYPFLQKYFTKGIMVGALKG